MANRQGKSKRWSKGGPSVEERVKELVSVLDEGVRNFEYSPEEFKALLEMKALMPNYSFKNIMVAKTQFPNASYIASFKRWNELGRNIKLGSKAIRIFKPKFIKVKDEHGNETGETQLVGFITVPVFALEQTEGDPLIEYAEQIAEEDNCPITYGDAQGANGYYSRANHEIVVSDTLSVNHRCKTLVHELVHSKVHRYDTTSSTSEKEVVAEGTAFIVCSFFGLDTSDYSFRYVNSWSKHDPDSLLNYGSMICDISGRIINEFRTLMEANKEEKNLQTA